MADIEFPEEDKQESATGSAAKDMPVPDPDFNDDPDLEVEQDTEGSKGGYKPLDFYENLVMLMSPDEHDALAKKYVDLLDVDKTAREKRDEQYAEGIKRTGVSNDAPGGALFQGASRAVHPGLAEAQIDFCARAMREIVPPSGPVRIKIDGKLTKARIDRAERKKRHMNWQLTTQISEYRGIMENIFTQLPLGGAAFQKWYPDAAAKRPRCEFVRCDAVYFPYNQDFYSAERVFHKYGLTQYAIDRRVSTGLFEEEENIIAGGDDSPTKVQIQIDKAEGQKNPDDKDDGTTPYIDVYFFDRLDIDDSVNDDLPPAPYWMTINLSTNKVVALYRNWEETDATQAKMDWLIKYGFLPWDGGLEIGLAHVAGSLSGMATGLMRALNDAALTQNIPTAVMSKGTAINGQTKQIGVCQVTELDNRQITDDINKIFKQIPFNPVSPILLSLLQFADEKFAGIVKTTAETSNDNQNMPVGTKLANIEQALQTYASIHARMHEAQGRALAVVHRINKLYMDKETPYDHNLGFAIQKDYEDSIDIQPVSDPNIFCESQRYGQVQAVFQMMAQFPQAQWDLNTIIRWALATMRIPNTDGIFPEDKKPKDENPVTENIMMCMGQQAIALPDQDHMAHLDVLLDFMESMVLGGNPLFIQTFLPPAIEHGKQHVLYFYGKTIKDDTEKALGVPMGEVKDEDEEVGIKFTQLLAAVSPMVVQQMPQLLQRAFKTLGMAQQKLQSMQPPQINPLEIEAKAQAADEKAKMAEAQNKAVENQVREKEVATKAQTDEMKIAEDERTKQMAAQTKLMINEQDNQTAEQIAAARVVSDVHIGNLKNGNSLQE